MKSLCWVLLFAGAGVVLFFLIIIAPARGISRTKDQIPLAIAVLMWAASAMTLRFCYRREPANFAGFWHLSLADLLACTFFSGFAMALFRAIWPDHFLSVGVVLTVLTGLIFSVCLMLAQRRGCVLARHKFPCALGYLLWVVGWMLAGMLFFIFAYEAIADGRIRRNLQMLSAMVFFTRSDMDELWILNIFRFGFLAIPAGYFLRRETLSAAEKKAKAVQ